jgi:ubiquinone/menaquinone biosynthesis C-methylase UbiE
MNRAMCTPEFTRYRKQVLASVTGEVLEIGAGTGLNFPLYPDTVEKVTAIDPNPGMKRFADRNSKESAITIDYRLMSGEELLFDNDSFDSGVSTWTLCSIPRIDRAISEIYRVLKPGGTFHFIEHGLSDDRSVQTWQNRLTPLQKIIADGCHLNRPIRKIITEKFQRIEIEEFYTPELPKIIGYLSKGIATK